MTATVMRQVILFGLVGLSLAVAQLVSLGAVVRRYVHGGGRAGAIVLHLTRVALIASAWVAVARIGGARGLLAAFAVFLIARPLLMRRIARAWS